MTHLKAQDKLVPFSYGLKFGVSVSEVQGAEELNYLRAEILAGVQAEYKFNKKISIQPELIYTRQGSVNRGNSNGTQFDNTLRLDYLNLPILFKYYLTEGLALELGPRMSYLINAQYKTIVGPESSILEISKQF